MYIRSFSIDWSGEIGRSYVADIEAIRALDSFTFQKNITFFAGENGSGKSTLLEALAIACGLNPEGGTANYNFSTYDDYSELGSAITLCRGISRPEWSYFLRAESFYNVASAAVREYNLTDYHARSHGESFLEFIQSVMYRDCISWTSRMRIFIPLMTAGCRRSLMRRPTVTRLRKCLLKTGVICWKGCSGMRKSQKMKAFEFDGEKNIRRLPSIRESGETV